MTAWPELSEPDPVPGEPVTLPDGRASRVTRSPDSSAPVALSLADLTRPDRLGESFRVSAARSLEDAAAPLEVGRVVVLAVNLGTVRGRVADLGFGDANALVRLAGVAREPDTGAIQGLWLADGLGEWFADEPQLAEGWLAAGGWMAFANRSR